MNFTRRTASTHHVLVADRKILDEKAFTGIIALERKRTERSRKPILLMLLNKVSNCETQDREMLSKIVSRLSLSTRETDVTGWYVNHRTVGILFTELVINDKSAFLQMMLSRVTDTLRTVLTAQHLSEISISCHLFPEHWDVDQPPYPGNAPLYPDVAKRDEAKKVFSAIKRLMDIIGSLALLLLGSPLFLAFALAVKISSGGPILFKQRRIGQFGKPFILLKFRSMYVGNDASVHKEYVKQLIAGRAPGHSSNGKSSSVYKLTADSRVTRLGTLLRKTSMDELPQFINVLKGDMSLVGPRPPVPYEVEHYDLWHRRRLLEAKPGITGLWQVSGRNRIKFDDMVRLDLMYATTWSPWLDIKILLRTPLAVLQGAD